MYFISIDMSAFNLILTFQIIVLFFLSFFTLKRITINENSIIISYILQFRQMKYKKEDIDFLQFYYNDTSKDQSIVLRMKPSNSRFKVTLNDWVKRSEIIQIITYLKDNNYCLKFKGNFYWLKDK